MRWTSTTSERVALSKVGTIGIVSILLIAGAIGYVALTAQPEQESTTSVKSTASTSSTTTTLRTTTGSAFSLEPINSSQLVDDSWTETYDSLDPQFGFSTMDGFFANVFQGLVQFNGSDSDHVVPSIAQGWTVSANYKQWNFTIRPHVTFSNGDPVNAYVGWFSFVRGYILNAPPGTYVSNYLDLLENISNPCTGSTPNSCATQEGNAYGPSNQWIWGLRMAVANTYGIPVTNENELVAALLSVLGNFNPAGNASQLALVTAPNQGIRVINNMTLQINLLQSYSSLLVVLPPQWGAFVDPLWIDHAVVGHEYCGGVVNNTGCTNFNEYGGPGTGPYEYSTIGPSNRFVVLTANPNYWAKQYNWSDGTPSRLCLPGEACQPVLEPPSISTITMNFGTYESTFATNFGSNQVQLGVVGVGSDSSISASFGQLYASYKYSEYYAFGQLFHGLGYPLEEFGIGLNGQIFPTNYTDFRLAMVHAVNYSELVSQLYTYKGQALAQVFQPPAPPGWGLLDNPENISLYSYNLTLAAQYLNVSGWEGDFYTHTNASIGSLPAGSVLGNPDGQSLPAITYMYIVPLTADMATQDNIIASGLGQIGIRVNFFGITGCGYGGPECSPSGGNYSYFPQMEGVAWAADWPDPIFQLFEPLAVSGAAGELSASVTNTTLLALLDRIPFETNPVQQEADAARAWAVYSQLAGILQLPLPENYVFAQPYVQGLIYSPFQFSYFYNMIHYEAP